MTLTQTVDIPADRRFTIEAPIEVPTGKMEVIIQFPTDQTPKDQVPAPAFEPHPCPLCRERQDPVTGEMRYGPKTRAGMQEVDDMLAGKIPNTLKSFNTFEEMLADLNDDEE